MEALLWLVMRKIFGIDLMANTVSGWKGFCSEDLETIVNGNCVLFGEENNVLVIGKTYVGKTVFVCKPSFLGRREWCSCKSCCRTVLVESYGFVCKNMQMLGFRLIVCAFLSVMKTHVRYARRTDRYAKHNMYNNIINTSNILHA